MTFRCRSHFFQKYMIQQYLRNDPLSSEMILEAYEIKSLKDLQFYLDSYGFVVFKDIFPRIFSDTSHRYQCSMNFIKNILPHTANMSIQTCPTFRSFMCQEFPNSFLPKHLFLLNLKNENVRVYLNDVQLLKQLCHFTPFQKKAFRCDEQKPFHSLHSHKYCFYFPFSEKIQTADTESFYHLWKFKLELSTTNPHFVVPLEPRDLLLIDNRRMLTYCADHIYRNVFVQSNLQKKQYPFPKKCS